MDVHVPVLERMYHKRLKGYAELGYQVKFGAHDDHVSMIYDGHTSAAAFEQDLSNAARSLVIFSPYIQKGRVSKLLPALQEIVADGITVPVHTREVESYDPIHQPEIQETILLLRQTGTQVLTHQGLQQRYAVIDESVVWYGNVDFFAFGRKDAEVLRFVNSDVAGELLELSQENCEEQMMIEEM